MDSSTVFINHKDLHPIFIIRVLFVTVLIRVLFALDSPKIKQYGTAIAIFCERMKIQQLIIEMRNN
jgi:hypothetical protein